jgi:hypothetical protein
MYECLGEVRSKPLVVTSIEDLKDVLGETVRYQVVGHLIVSYTAGRVGLEDGLLVARVILLLC